MELVDGGRVTTEAGLEGDHKGAKLRKRQITIMAAEDWQAALDALAGADGSLALPWTTRRANLLVGGLRLPRSAGAELRIGPVRLEVTYETVPCARMEAAYPGLLKALFPDWRGGVTCRVLDGGVLSVGDRIEIVSAPLERVVRLP